MTEFTQFEAVEPIVIPATEEKVYDKYWLELMIIRAPSPAQDASLTAKFRLYNDITREFAPSADSINVEVPKVFEKALSDIGFATAMEYVLRALKVELDKKITPVEETTTTTTEGE